MHNSWIELSVREKYQKFDLPGIGKRFVFCIVLYNMCVVYLFATV